MKKKVTTLYFQPKVHKALKLQAIINECSMSDLAEDIIKSSLEEDLEDIKTFKRRKKEASVSLNNFIQTLKRDGKI